MRQIRIIVATPRPVQRSRLAKALSAQPGLLVVAQASDLSETYTQAERLQPDLVLLAEEYIRVPEFACMKLQFSALSAAWLVISAPGSAPDSARRSDLGHGAIDTQLPVAEIVGRIQAATAARGATSRPNALGLATATPTSHGLGSHGLASHGMALPALIAHNPTSAGRPRSEIAGQMDRVVLIGASTGGIDALLTVLSGFPVDCPPTAIVQHTGRNFSESLIALLDRRCAPKVVAAEDGGRLQSGVVCVAGGSDGHLRLTGGDALRCQISPGPPVSGHVPSVDALFLSALPIAERVVAALLTGMGRDGAEGLLALRQHGATTIGQDEASAVVYGMPRAAQELGAVQTQLPLPRIGPEILRNCQTTIRAVAR